MPKEVVSVHGARIVVRRAEEIGDQPKPLTNKELEEAVRQAVRSKYANGQVEVTVEATRTDI